MLNSGSKPLNRLLAMTNGLLTVALTLKEVIRIFWHISRGMFHERAMEVQRRKEEFTTMASDFAHMLYREFAVLPSGVSKFRMLSTEVYNAGMMVDCSSPGFASV